MALSDAKKKEIEEEEAYRAEISGHSKEKKSIGCLGWLGIIVVLGILGIVLLSTINPFGQIEREKQTQSQLTNDKYVFDVPALIGKDKNGVITVLGNPQGQDPTALQIQQGVKEWEKGFVKDGKDLLVTYTISTGKIIDFFISTDDPSGSTTNTVHLLQIGNLRENDPRYRVEFVKAIKTPGSLTGVKVIPN